MTAPISTKERGLTARVVQNGVTVAEVTGPNADAVRREIMHYAMMYAQDGPVEVHGIDLSPGTPAGRRALSESGPG